MPSVPYLLADLLASPLLSPYTLGEQDLPTKAAQFNVLAKSLIYQIISAVSYLHSENIAHRDIKPHNLLITDHGCVKLIDFGIAWKSCEDMADKTDDLWPEPPDRMYFEVATGPYRAPELLFGTRCYDANATDLWSLGATLAEFLTPLRLRISDPDDDDDDDDDDNDEEDDESEYPLEEEQSNARPFITPDLSRITNPKLRWSRETLFDASRGEIGLAWSIFKIRGTPTAENWPTFANLPHSSRVTFNVVPPVDLSLLLPNCPTTAKVEVDSKAGHFPTAKMIPSPLDLVYRLLVYPEHTRLRASEALLHPWFTTDPPVLLPKGYPTVPTFSTAFWEGKTLGEWLIMTLPPAAASP